MNNFREQLNKKKCICGRTETRMSKVTGRTDDMLIIRGEMYSHHR